MNKNNDVDPYTDFIQAAPVQYINRKGSLQESGKFINQWGKKCLISAGERAWGAAGEKIEASLAEYGIPYDRMSFSGECCDQIGRAHV